MKWISQKSAESKLVVLTLIAISLLSSCVSTNISSGRTGTYAGKAKKVFLKVQSNPEYHIFLSSISREIEDAFRARDIAVNLYIYEAQSDRDNPQMIEKYISTFGADLILEMAQTDQSDEWIYAPSYYTGNSLNGGQSHMRSSSTLRLRIIDRTNGSPIWQARMDNKTNSIFSNMKNGSGVEKTARKIIEALVNDGILQTLETKIK